MSNMDSSVEEVIISHGSGHDHMDSVDSSRHNSLGALRCTASKSCRDKYYRKLSIASIICGLSCIGILAFKYSVKAKETQRHDPKQAEVFAKKAKKFSIISIVVFFLILVSIPVLLALISYLATFKD